MIVIRFDRIKVQSHCTNKKYIKMDPELNVRLEVLTAVYLKS